MMLGRYILEGKVPVPCEDLLTWGRWIAEKAHDRVVKQQDVGGDLWVSTVFLALDHSFGEGPPLLFETMVFRKSTDADQKEMDEIAERRGWEKIACPQHISLDYADRTATWELALEAHAKAVKWAKKQLH